jgi:hypothetical protein
MLHVQIKDPRRVSWATVYRCDTLGDAIDKRDHAIAFRAKLKLDRSGVAIRIADPDTGEVF